MCPIPWVAPKSWPWIHSEYPAEQSCRFLLPRSLPHQPWWNWLPDPLFQNDQRGPLCADMYLFRWGNLYDRGSTIVDDQVDSFDVDSSTKEISCHQKSGSICLEKIVILDTFFLLQLGMNADGVEEFLTKQLSQFFSTIYPVDKDDHLVESQSVQKMSQLFKLFILH